MRLLLNIHTYLLKGLDGIEIKDSGKLRSFLFETGPYQ